MTFLNAEVDEHQDLIERRNIKISTPLIKKNINRGTIHTHNAIGIYTIEMSFRGGRGGGNNGFQRNLPFGLDYQDVTKLTESEKPSIILPVNGSMADEEKIISSHFINFKTNVRDGPFYTGDSLEVSKSKKHEVHEDGLNDGLKRYSDKYLKKRSIGHSIDDHPYSIEFFPQELYRVMGVDDQKKKKLLQLSKLRSSKQVLESLNNDEIGNTILEKLKEMADVDDEKDDERDDIEENLDDEFEEEDDDDYNAEKYFDDGEDFGDEDDYNDEAAF